MRIWKFLFNVHVYIYIIIIKNKYLLNSSHFWFFINLLAFEILKPWFYLVFFHFYLSMPCVIFEYSFFVIAPIFVFYLVRPVFLSVFIVSFHNLGFRLCYSNPMFQVILEPSIVFIIFNMILEDAFSIFFIFPEFTSISILLSFEKSFSIFLTITKKTFVNSSIWLNQFSISFILTIFYPSFIIPYTLFCCIFTGTKTYFAVLVTLLIMIIISFVLITILILIYTFSMLFTLRKMAFINVTAWKSQSSYTMV